MHDRIDYLNRINSIYEQELEDLTLKSNHSNGIYNQRVAYRIAFIRNQIHQLKLQRLKLIRDFYSNYKRN